MNEMGKNQSISLEMINLIVIIGVLIGCAHWALVVQGGLGNATVLIVVFEGMI